MVIYAENGESWVGHERLCDKLIRPVWQTFKWLALQCGVMEVSLDKEPERPGSVLNNLTTNSACLHYNLEQIIAVFQSGKWRGLC